MTRRRRAFASIVVTLLVTGCASSDDVADTTDPATSAETTSSEAPATSDEPDTREEDPGTATAVGTADENSAFPDIIAAQATREDAGTWRFDVTVSSPYDTPERYADAWRVLDASGTELGIRILTHDHANEQPFTRSQGGITIPDDVTTVTIEGRDLVNGWGGSTLDVILP